MEEQTDETFSKRTVSDSDEELNHEYTEFNKDWKDVITINPDDSTSQIFRLDSEVLLTIGSSVQTYFDKNPPGVHNHLVQQLICDLQPFTIVDNNYFRKFVNFFCPRYVIPDRHKIKGKIHL